MEQVEQVTLITDFITPGNKIFTYRHKIGDRYYGPGDPSCVMCKGIGIIVGVKCNCQNNYLVQLINYANTNGLKLEQYYSPIQDESNLTEYQKKRLNAVSGNSNQSEL